MIQEKICNIGDFTYYGNGFTVNNRATTIGKYCSIAHGVILGPGQHEVKFLTTSPIIQNGIFIDFPPASNPEFIQFQKKIKETEPHHNFEPVTVGNDVWIANNVTVQDGVKIGDGAIVGSGAVVTRDVPPYAIVGGVPARVIKYRFGRRTIRALLEVKWWELPHEFIATLPFHDVGKSIQMCREYRRKNSL